MTDSSQSAIERPEPAYHPGTEVQSDDVIERHPDLEATELEEYSHDQHDLAESSVSGAATAGRENNLHRVITTESKRKGSDNGLKKFWRHHVRISVYHQDCRDHFALERTFLGYLRTSASLAMIGVVVAQLFRLQSNPDAVDDFGFYQAGKSLSALLIAAAIFVMLLGTARFWRLQNAIVRGKIIAAGWELHVLTAVCVALLVAMIAIIARVNVGETGNYNPPSTSSS